MENNIFSELAEDYTGKTEVLFSRKVSVDHETPELFNGFAASFDVLKDKGGGIFDKMVSGRMCVPEVKYNYPDENLYVVMLYNFSVPLTEEELAEVKEFSVKTLEKEVIPCKLGKEEFIIKLRGVDDISYIKQTPLEAPANFLFLEDIFEDEKDGPGYTEFLNHELSFNRLKKLCDKIGYEVTEDMVTGVMLPIHRKHTTTGAMLVHEQVKHQYAMYKLAQNYLRGFEEGSNEYAIGVAMAYDIKFNDYVLRVAKRQEAESKDPDADNFTDEFNRAIKRINKKEYV